MFYLTPWLIVLILVIYAFGKVFLYYKLINGELRFFWQNQFDPNYRGDFSGYIWAMAVITWWPLTAPVIKSALKQR